MPELGVEQAPAKPEPILQAWKQCRICGRGRVPQNFRTYPQFCQCDYCRTIHVSALGWLVVLEESVFLVNRKETEQALHKVIQSFIQMTSAELVKFAHSNAFTDMVNTAQEKFRPRQMSFAQSSDWLGMALRDFRLMHVPMDPQLLSTWVRVQHMAEVEEHAGGNLSREP